MTVCEAMSLTESVVFGLFVQVMSCSLTCFLTGSSTTACSRKLMARYYFANTSVCLVVFAVYSSVH
jgi:hypothetical protein